MLPYYLIPLIGSIALTAVFVFVTNARAWTKLLAIVLEASSFYWKYGMFLQVTLCISILLYLAYLKARHA